MLDAIILSRSPTTSTLLSAPKSTSQIIKTHLIRSTLFPNTQYPRKSFPSLPISRTFPTIQAKTSRYDVRTCQQLNVPRSSMPLLSKRRRSACVKAPIRVLEKESIAFFRLDFQRPTMHGSRSMLFLSFARSSITD
jgi:hypothetical protein